MKRTCLTAAVLASALGLGIYSAPTPAAGIYLHIGGGTDLGYRFSGKNRYNLNTRPYYRNRHYGDRAVYWRPGFTVIYGYPYSRHRNYRQHGYSRDYRHGYRDGYRDGRAIRHRHGHYRLD